MSYAAARAAYNAGLARPYAPWCCTASANVPAYSGEERLVPPMRNSEDFTVPSGKRCVCRTSMPVFGSPSAETSGTARIGFPPYVREMALGTTPAWNDGWGNSLLVPPPEPLVYARSPQAGWPVLFLTSELRPVSQPSSKSRVFEAVTPMDVPPTAVTQGLDAGQSGVGVAVGSPKVSSPKSPLEKKTLIPSAAAWISVSLRGLM